MFQKQIAALSAAAIFFIAATPATAVTMREFRKFTPDEQSMYVVAAVNMLAYNYAATGNVAKASCIRKWFYGDRKGIDPPSARELAIAENTAAKLNPDQYHIEGVILGAVDKACGPDSQTPRP